MDLGLGTAIATGAGVYAVYGDKGKVAAASAVITGVVLYAAYYCKLLSNPNINGYMMMGKNKIKNWKPLTQQELLDIKNRVDYYYDTNINTMYNMNNINYNSNYDIKIVSDP